MVDDHQETAEEYRRRFEGQIARKASRRLRARRRPDSPWFWLGMLGLIGWSVAVPTLLGVALGLWLDEVIPAGFSWTLSMLVVGLALGILNVWFWVRQESADEEEEGEESEPPGSGEDRP